MQLVDRSALTNDTLMEWRCMCNRILAFVRLRPGSVINLKCGKCGKLNVLAT